MSRGISLVVSLALGAASLAVSAPARACKCMLPTVETAREDASALFEGRVLAIAEARNSNEAAGASELGDAARTGLHQRKDGGEEASATNGELRVTLAVVRTWKGLERHERVDVLTNGSSAAYGYTFAKDVSYLVYAREQEGRLYVIGCSRTRPLADASEDLRFLGAGSTPVQIGDKGKAGDAGASATSSPTPDAGAGAPGTAARAGRSRSCAALPASGSNLGMAFPAIALALTLASRRRRRSPH